MCVKLRIWTVTALCFLCSTLTITGQDFINIAPQSGIEAVLYDNLFSSGLSFADFNGDGLDDLTIGMTGGPIQVHKNTGNGFIELDPFTPNLGTVKAVQWVDYDNDGDRDFFVAVRDGGLHLYKNENEVFTDIAAEAGFDPIITDYYGASWADYDLDGDLDVYICNQLFSNMPGEPEQLNFLYRNDGDDTFTNVTAEAGVTGEVELSFQSLWLDYNFDLYPDLYVINDKVSPNRLYRNNGDGTFTDISEIGDAGIVMDAMTASYGDYNNDLLPDIYITNTQVGGNALLEAQPDGSFIDKAADQDIILFDYTWGAVWFDMDNDMDEDLYIAESEALAFNSPNYLFENMGPDFGYSFTDASDQLTTPDNSDAYTAALGDLNNDGHMDIAVHNREPYNIVIWENQGTENNWFKVDLAGSISNRDGVGCWIHLYTEEQDLIRYTHLGEQYLAQNSFVEHFGLGQQTVVDSIMIEWPSGLQDHLYELDANQTILVQEGSSYSPAVATSDDFLCPGDSLLLTAEVTDPVWSSGQQGTSIWVTEPGVYSYSGELVPGLNYTSQEVQITFAPEVTFELDITPPFCHNTNIPQIEVNVVGDDENEDFTVFYQGAEITNPYFDLPQEDVFLTVIDEFGCSHPVQDTPNAPTPIEIISEIDSIDCYGQTASIELVISGGTGAYDIQGDSQNDLGPGTYTYVISDENECETSIDVIVEEPLPLSTDLTFEDAINGNTGSIDLTVSGGTEPYTFSWTGPDNYTSDAQNIDMLAPGVYTCIVTDANGCITTVAQNIYAVGITEEIASTTRLYPNPANASAFLTWEYAFDTVEIRNTLGEVILSEELNGRSSIEIDCSLLSEGLYFIHLNSASNTLSWRRALVVVH